MGALEHITFYSRQMNLNIRVDTTYELLRPIQNKVPSFLYNIKVWD